jgi:hypothetical protein
VERRYEVYIEITAEKLAAGLGPRGWIKCFFRYGDRIEIGRVTVVEAKPASEAREELKGVA